MRLRRLTILGFWVPLAAATAQARGRAGIGENVASAADGAARQGVATHDPERQPNRQNFWVILASAAVPGSGQAILGASRALPYVALEAYGWTRYLDHAAVASEERRRYRSLAAQVARSAFSDRRPVGDFSYYERIEKFAESGAFSLSSSDDLVPEADTTTYNGFVWLLARRTYWKNINQPPDRTSDEWKLAQQFYSRRAYGSDFRWSWKDADLEYEEYKQLIRRSNAENRIALQSLGILIANHVLSMVDAYIIVRLKAVRGDSQESRKIEIDASLPLRLTGR